MIHEWTELLIGLNAIGGIGVSRGCNGIPAEYFFIPRVVYRDLFAGAYNVAQKYRRKKETRVGEVNTDAARRDKRCKYLTRRVLLLVAHSGCIRIKLYDY